MASQPIVEWPYSTHDEVSHLVCADVELLRARIDQLIEERRQGRVEEEESSMRAPMQWGLTPGEERMLLAMARAPENAIVSKEKLHSAFAGQVEPTTELKLVDVIVCKLRKKLAMRVPEGETGVIDTVWGRGYSLRPWVRGRLLSA